mgnify:FL=1
MNESFDAWLNTHQKRIDDFIEKNIKKNYPKSYISDVCSYSILNGGKRFRALLVYAIGEINNTNKNLLDHISCALELTHTYSLIHDDLPAMDNDDLRRGKPSCHIKFNEAQAILAGDGIQAMAIELICNEDFEVKAEDKVKLIKNLCASTGIKGMVLGQSLDMQSSSNINSLNLLEEIQELKTGRLIELSCLMPLIIINDISQNEKNKIINLSKVLGKIYQITDDILDVSSNEKELGKTCGKDKKDAKATYLSLMSLTEARKINEKFFSQINKEIDSVHGDTEILKNLVAIIYKRKF